MRKKSNKKGKKKGKVNISEKNKDAIKKLKGRLLLVQILRLINVYIKNNISC